MDTNVRDLSDPLLWERSLARARHRRRIFEMGRKHARRRKATSVALAGAVAAAPTTPLLPVAAAHSPSVAAGAVDDGLRSSHATSILLQRGSVGDAVAQVQARIGVDDDGIFGPITERAVRKFQAAHGLEPNGVVDAATWSAIFRSRVVFMKEPAPSPSSSPRDAAAQHG
ncbi:MAG TPA: peptidoglycan-binding domain-containing protein, partial [Solirubrobacteraceae bacterium]|nr:peptidoglycan-binding domain-containing protein [Solirubrobacteraceae bacterium]